MSSNLTSSAIIKSLFRPPLHRRGAVLVQSAKTHPKSYPHFQIFKKSDSAITVAKIAIRLFSCTKIAPSLERKMITHCNLLQIQQFTPVFASCAGHFCRFMVREVEC
ncbi:MAG: hypothetical protein HYS17_07525 [Micavibrio aeruginosavorus]|uniref:Uncharacterized protein n=1 Tax=Micavibrio aeruginosavorus TaxID=349221 RepID=A0A7T5R0Q9_9BACT|nr:MAG: hypothetical protein HYS17_07525 [Micavibrio aeruginosavorus]